MVTSNFDEGAKLSKSSEGPYSQGGCLTLQDILSEWAAKSVACDIRYFELYIP